MNFSFSYWQVKNKILIEKKSTYNLNTVFVRTGDTHTKGRYYNRGQRGNGSYPKELLVLFSLVQW